MRYGMRGLGVLTVVCLVAVWLWSVGAARQDSAERAAAAPGGAAATPRMPNGRPDFNGRWGGGGGGGRKPVIDANGNINMFGNYRKGNPTNGERDSGLEQRFGPNFPLYKPEYWDKVDHLDNHGNVEDSAFHCMPSGVPRIGPPMKIMQNDREIVFMYQQRNTWRVIPIDGRPHDPVNSKDQTFLGDSIGRWEGDTLVVDVVGFNDTSWIGWPGYFHTSDMRVEERLRREGNTLHYQATVYDPEVLVQPWAMDPRRLNLNTSNAAYIEDPPCIETDGANLATRERG